MLRAYLRTPVRFWFRFGMVASLLWFVIGTLWHWTSLGQESANSYMRHLQVCQAKTGNQSIECVAYAGKQLTSSQSNAWPTAIGESLFQIALVWLISVIVILGTRWAARALESGPAVA